VPSPTGPRPNPLPTLERWKLLDNLRRSLIPPALIFMLALGWTALPGSPWLWTVLAVAVPVLPLVKWFLGATMGCARTGTLIPLKSWRENVAALGGQALLAVVFLADQARLMCDAIVRTLVRMLITRRKLLEWETAASTEQRLGTGLIDFIKSMWPASALSVILAVAALSLRPGAIWAAWPLLLAWFVSPLVAFWVSRPRRLAARQVAPEEARVLRRVARKTWRFFETFVGDADHWLPPDNFQEVPDGRIAHRTSPTNQGLLLVSTLAAHDLGYLGFESLATRLEKTFDTLEKLQTHWGHFYNWYNTTTLQPLPPAYISTVDSGNFLGCLVALRQGLREKLDEPILSIATIEGLSDTFQLIDERWRQGSPIEALLAERPHDLATWDHWLGRLESRAEELHRRIREDSRLSDDTLEPEHWAGRLLFQIRERREELAAMAPWLSRLTVRTPGDGPDAGADDPGDELAAMGSLEELARRARNLLDTTSERGPEEATGPSPEGGTASALADRLRSLAQRAEAMAARMDFRPLYKPERHLYAIGVDLSRGQPDGPCYDLLASESCLTSYLTVARGDAPRRHWFHLGRPFIHAAGRIGLISWGGTMFEYLMPRLLLRSLNGTLLSEACETAVARQIEYGRHLGIPWGVSESAFNAQYLEGDYRYQSFGVPGLGLKRGLENDRVVAPYATAMATMIAPREAVENLRRLAAEGAEGPFGFYEAVDYTPERLAQNQHAAVVRSYMAHHQGMSLMALTNVLLDDVMPRRFHSDPMVRAAELLLQERIPPDSPIVGASPTEADAARPMRSSAGSLLIRRLTTPATTSPRTHLISNTHYHVMITNAGAGYGRCQSLDVTRWREDPTCEDWGLFFYIRDRQSGLLWSAGHQPVCHPADSYEVVFSADRAAIRRRDGDIETLQEITVSPEQLAEVRRITLTNHGTRPRELELTSYAEVVLNHHAADLVHPGFGKLFLETEQIAESDALLCHRRPRSSQERPIWAVCVMAVDRSSPGGSLEGNLQVETDRARFLGRGRTPADPAAMAPGTHLSGTLGATLDPVFCLRRRFHLEPGGSIVLGLTLGIAESREAAMAMADKYHGISAVSRAFELAWAQSQVEHGHRNWLPEDTHLYQRLGAHLIFATPALRGHPASLSSNSLGFPALARLGISSNRPLVLLRIAEPGEKSLARQLLIAQEFLRLKGLESELVMLNEERAGNTEGLNDQLQTLVRNEGFGENLNQPGGVSILQRESLTDEEVRLLEAAARVVLDGARGSLSGQLDRMERLRALPAPLAPARSPVAWHDEPVSLPRDLELYDGLGGFCRDGREYCLLVTSEEAHAGPLNGQTAPASALRPHLPPAPWINVVANEAFGFLVSESGSGYTWSGNSQTNRLTSWNNDPVMDPPSEAIYLRDEATGETWCPTPLPIPSHAPTLIRHGFGYTVFQRRIHGVEHELTLFVPPDEPVKLIRLRVRNPHSEPRRLSATFYAEWVLGNTREENAMHVVTEVDPDTGALLARNVFREDFAARVAFAEVNQRPRTLTADRGEFLGRHGSATMPAALDRGGLSERTGAGIDPCAAIQTVFDLGPGASHEVVFLLGEAEDVDAARRLIRRYWDPSATSDSLERASDRWSRLLTAVQVRTPEPSFDRLMNGWLLYQVTACRLLARSSLYQSGGAFGFRDQLQDVMALVHAAPDLARRQILLAASRQFVEGDVQHWWHPPAGRGVRTRISDDFLWLALVTSHYVETTGDSSILDACIPFLDGPSLAPGVHDEYGLPRVSGETASLYEHCVRALDHGLRFGLHGLPLMGGGDWNDGMNRVGIEGRGESVWLGWFLVCALNRFASVAESRGDSQTVARYREHAESIRRAVESHAWDGSWYLRAFFDDGRALGSSRNRECQIDSLAQTWGILAEAADPARARSAMEAVWSRLCGPEDGLIRLLDPPFDDESMDPGYIKGYLPGVRENGGQYTHAAVWVAIATAMLGEGERAFDLLQRLNPLRRTRDLGGIARYKGEPYVLAGDVYSRAPHAGRCGWTWYTGAAAWFYRAGLEFILGLRREGNRLALNPCIPSTWKRFEITYRERSTTYKIVIENPRGITRGTTAVTVDGHPCATGVVEMIDDGQAHEVTVVMESS
jgi:cyclic beta-1,2-glucan synthetase